MPTRIPTADMTIFLAGDEQWTDEWGITYVLDRIQQYGNTINHIFALGNSVPAISVKKYADEKGIFHCHIPYAHENWMATAMNNGNGLAVWRPPTHFLLFANHVSSDPTTSELVTAGLMSEVMIGRIVDRVSHYTLSIISARTKEKELVDIPYPEWRSR